MSNATRRIASSILTWAALAAIALGLAYLAFPGLGLAGELSGWLLAFASPALCLALAIDEERPRASVAALCATVLGMALLPLVLAVYAAADLPPPALRAFAGLLALGPLLALALAMQPRKAGAQGAAGTAPARRAEARADRGGLGARKAASWLLAAATFAAGLLALAGAARAMAAPEKGLFGVMVPQFLPHFAFAFLALGALAFRAARAAGIRPRAAWAFGLPAALAFLVGLLPLAQTPMAVARADRAFREAFGIEASGVAGEGFRPWPFSMGRFFLGAAPAPARLEKDLVYSRERSSKGRDYEFTFDAWRPEAPGAYPVLVRVHGGAWVSGDKGAMNMGGMNRYFASRGYAVFDIQYGLSEEGRFSLKGEAEPTEGPFAIDDMVRQVSAFSSYLAEHAQELGADIGRVFVSGGSAGGHLALAAALAASSGYREAHPGIGLDPRLRVAGLVPFYPALGLARGIGVPGSAELDDPRQLISRNAPPALVYQGGHDGMVSMERTRAFAEAWARSGAGPLALVEFPSAGHGSDLAFWGPYNQVFLYYMERFMALESRASPL